MARRSNSHGVEVFKASRHRQLPVDCRLLQQFLETCANVRETVLQKVDARALTEWTGFRPVAPSIYRRLQKALPVAFQPDDKKHYNYS